MTGFSSARIEKLIKEAGQIKVSDDAKEWLYNHMVEKGTKLAKESIKIAKKNGRSKVNEYDVMEASYNIRMGKNE